MSNSKNVISQKIAYVACVYTFCW